MIRPGGMQLTVIPCLPTSRDSPLAHACTAAFALKAPFTPIPLIQGSAANAAITGAVTTEGVVVGDYEGPSLSPQIHLRGYYIQDPIGDGDPARLFHMQTNLRFGCVILRHYLDIERGDLFLTLGRYNGSRGRPEYPNAVFATRKLWEPPPPA